MVNSIGAKRRWFLSYNSQDFRLAQDLQEALHRNDPDARVFYAPESLRAGGFWLPQLAREIGDATAFILLIGKRGIGPWQTVEFYEAFSRRVKEPGFAVVIVLLDGQQAPGLPFLRQLHWVITVDPSSERSLAQMMDAADGGGMLPGELWRYTAPYRGLSAMTESNSDFFFGRKHETANVIKALAQTPGRLPLLLGNSGVGKSSLARAGVIAAFMRQALPDIAETPSTWPLAFSTSRFWCFLTLAPGGEPVSELVKQFVRIWQLDAIDPNRWDLQEKWTSDLLTGKRTLHDLLNATQDRYRDQLHLPEPPAFFIYVDQGEELFVRAEEREGRRFSEILVEGLDDRRLRAIMSMRADFFGYVQKDEPLYTAHYQINVPPLREGQLRDVVYQPAVLLSARFETADLAESIVRRTAEESNDDAGALPELSYLLDDMWRGMTQRADGVLRLSAQSIDIGGVLGSRADGFLAIHPGSMDMLRRILTLKLATVREGEEPTRRRAVRSEFTDEEWRLVNELADDPNRLVVTATTETRDTYAELAHDAVLRRWGKLRNWIAAEREFLAWRTGLEAAYRSWEAMPEDAKTDALLTGTALVQARIWLAKRKQDLPISNQNFIALSTSHERKVRWRHLRTIMYVLSVSIVLGLIAGIYESKIKEEANWLFVMRPYMNKHVRPFVLKPQDERMLLPGASFRECDKDCPEMVVIPAGDFTMGTGAVEAEREGIRPKVAVAEQPRHGVQISAPFAVSKFDVTFADWDTCVAVGGCPREGRANDAGWGRGNRPVINVSWDDANTYVAWLSSVTGKPYRLLTEAEYEYAARGNTTTAYFWGNEIGKNNANCDGCGSQWDATQTAPVGEFTPNRFGLYDMLGNIYQWVEDCYHNNYVGVPKDGSAWTSGECKFRVVRGGSWDSSPQYVRSAFRGSYTPMNRDSLSGLRVARSLLR